MISPCESFRVSLMHVDRIMEKAIEKKKVVPAGMKDLWGIRLSKGKSRCRLEEVRRRKWRRRLQTPIPGRWITDVWPKAAWLNCKTKKTHLLFHSPVFYFSSFPQTFFPPSLPSVSQHYYYFPLWFTFLASVFTLSVPWRTPWSLLSTDGKYHFCRHKKRGGGWKASPNHYSQQRACFFSFFTFLLLHIASKMPFRTNGLEFSLKNV